MAAARRHDRAGLFRDRELNAGRARGGAVVRTLAAAKIDNPHQSERPQSRIVK
jgi:hypothetical protein